jgi:hypothetical protein
MRGPLNAHRRLSKVEKKLKVFGFQENDMIGWNNELGEMEPNWDRCDRERYQSRKL